LESATRLQKLVRNLKADPPKWRLQTACGDHFDGRTGEAKKRTKELRKAGATATPAKTRDSR
jgi:hypothetical protein